MGEQSIREFYDETGWNLVGDTTTDAIINENFNEIE
jgi:hypothetical protein